MTPQEQVNHFQTFGFLHCKQLLSPDEIQVISDGFDVAMRTAHGGTPEPTPDNEAASLAANLELSSPNRANQEQADLASPVVRQDVIPLFDYDPDVFYPLLDDERIFNIFERLLGEHFILAGTMTSRSMVPWRLRATLPCGLQSIWTHFALKTAA